MINFLLILTDHFSSGVTKQLVCGSFGHSRDTSVSLPVIHTVLKLPGTCAAGVCEGVHTGVYITLGYLGYKPT